MLYIPENVCYVLDRLNKTGYDAYLVGGCVRDSIMNKVPNDYDITTSAHPEQILNCFSDCRTLTNGIKHGTVGIVFDTEVIEVTTYRIDGTYTDNRHPDNVVFSSDIEDDLSRRDFTINAIACDINGNIVDPYCGMQDINRRFIRCVGNPDIRFNEDALRILRALRFSSVLDFDIDENTKHSIHTNARLLKNVSAERINTEFSKLLCGKRAGSVIREFFDVFCVFVPQLITTEQADVHKVSKAVDLSSENLVHRLSVFVGGFLGEQDADEALNFLKYDNHIKKCVLSIVKLLVNIHVSDKIYIKKMLSRNGFDIVLLLNDVQYSLEMCDKSDHDSFEYIVRMVKDSNECISVSQLAFDGNDCVRELDVKGRMIGTILDELCCAVIEERINNEFHELLSYAESHLEQWRDFGNE